LQELTELIRIKLLISRFLEIFGSYFQFPGGQCPFCPPADAHGHDGGCKTTLLSQSQF